MGCHLGLTRLTPGREYVTARVKRQRDRAAIMAICNLMLLSTCRIERL